MFVMSKSSNCPCHNDDWQLFDSNIFTSIFTASFCSIKLFRIKVAKIFPSILRRILFGCGMDKVIFDTAPKTLTRHSINIGDYFVNISSYQQHSPKLSVCNAKKKKEKKTRQLGELIN